MSFADELIAEANARKLGIVLPVEALEGIRKVIEHNVSASKASKIKRETVITALDAKFGIRITEKTLDRIVKREFGCTFGGCR